MAREAAGEQGAAAAQVAARRPRAVYLYLAIVVLSWAANWPLMKLALADVPPLSFVLLRMAGTMALLTPALLLMRQNLVPARGERLDLFWIGQLQIAGFLICSIIGLSIVPAGRAIVLGYTMPLWALPIELWLEPHTHAQGIRRGQLAGIIVGFAGLVLFMNPALVDWRDWRVLGGNAMLVLASICWALGSVLYRRRLWGSGFWAQTWWQLLVGSVPIVLLAVPSLLAEPIRWTPGLVAILGYNWVVTTALGYFLWNKVLAAMPAAVAGQIVALTPVGGFLLSTAIFGGQVTPDVLLSIAMIVGGIVLTLRR